MKTDIQKAVFDLFCICHDVTQAGPHQASMQYAAITNGVYVQVRPLAGATPVLDERVYLAGMPFQTEQQVSLRTATPVPGYAAPQLSRTCLWTSLTAALLRPAAR